MRTALSKCELCYFHPLHFLSYIGSTLGLSHKLWWISSASYSRCLLHPSPLCMYPGDRSCVKESISWWPSTRPGPSRDGEHKSQGACSAAFCWVAFVLFHFILFSFCFLPLTAALSSCFSSFMHAPKCSSWHSQFLQAKGWNSSCIQQPWITVLSLSGPYFTKAAFGSCSSSPQLKWSICFLLGLWLIYESSKQLHLCICATFHILCENKNEDKPPLPKWLCPVIQKTRTEENYKKYLNCLFLCLR